LNECINIENIFNNNEFPLFVKAREVNFWRKTVSGQKKGFLINTKSELEFKIKEFYNKKVPVIIQEVIKSSDNKNYKVCVYISKNGDYKLVFTLRKIHQYPIHFGIASCAESYKYTELKNIGLKLFTSIGYRGVGSAEFKYDEKDKKLKLIEINPRYWQQNILADFCGMNFPYIDYLESTGQNPKTVQSFYYNRKWLNLGLDIQSYFEYKKSKEITFFKWLKDIKGKKVISYINIKDPCPFFIYLYRTFLRYIKKFNRNC